MSALACMTDAYAYMQMHMDANGYIKDARQAAQTQYAQKTNQKMSMQTNNQTCSAAQRSAAQRRAKQSKAKQSKAQQSTAKQSKAKKAKRSEAKRSEAKHSIA